MKSIQKLIRKKTPNCTAVIVAAGSSTRFDGENKLFADICGIPVLAHTLQAFELCNAVSDIIVVTKQEDIEQVSKLCREYSMTKVSKIIRGGTERLDSVICGVFEVPKKSGLIAIHDGARPLVTPALIESTIRYATKKQAVAPAIAITSTVKRAIRGEVCETIDRDGLFLVQTPQVFLSKIIKPALINTKSKNINVTDDCMAVELLGFKVYLSEGTDENIKVTTKNDLVMAEHILKMRTDVCE